MPETSPINNLIESPIANRLDATTLLSADLEIEVDQAAFKLHAKNGKIIVSVDSLREARSLLKKVLYSLPRNEGATERLETFLIRINQTVYVQNRKLGIVGPRANPILRKLFHMYAARIM